MALLLAAVVGVLLGAALGVFGGGGGILAVPLLVGLLGMDVDHAATTSLVIVLFGAMAGLVSHHRAGRVVWRSGLVFGLSCVVGAMVGALAAPLVADWIKLAAFAVLLVAAAVAMLRKTRTADQQLLTASGGSHPGESGPGGSGAPGGSAAPGGSRSGAPAAGYRLAPVVALATGTGLVTGFLGVGGGFLVVPALVLSMGMAVPIATATGLVVVALASASALVVRAPNLDGGADLAITAVLVCSAIVASLASARISGRFSARNLARGFAYLVLAMAVLVGYQAVAAFPTA